MEKGGHFISSFSLRFLSTDISDRHLGLLIRLSFDASPIFPAASHLIFLRDGRRFLYAGFQWRDPGRSFPLFGVPSLPYLLVPRVLTASSAAGFSVLLHISARVF